MQKTAVKRQMNFLAFTSCQSWNSLLKTSLETGTFSFRENLSLPSLARWNFEFFKELILRGKLLFGPENASPRSIGSGLAGQDHKMQMAMLKNR
jgi:hypothetical protein